MKQKMYQTKQSTAKSVWALLEADPYATQALRMGIANVSAIARRLKKRIPSSSMPAIKAAVRRYAERKEFLEYYKDLKKILMKTRVELKSGMAVLTLFPMAISNLKKIFRETGGEISIISAPSGMTVILNERDVQKVATIIGRKNVRRRIKGVYSITLNSPEGIKDTPGFVAFVSELLARNGINILEFYSCYTDTVFILKKKDALKAYELLDKNMGQIL